MRGGDYSRSGAIRNNSAPSDLRTREAAIVSTTMTKSVGNIVHNRFVLIVIIPKSRVRRGSETRMSFLGSSVTEIVIRASEKLESAIGKKNLSFKRLLIQAYDVSVND